MRSSQAADEMDEILPSVNETIYETVNAKFATFLGSIPVSSDRVESEGRQM